MHHDLTLAAILGGIVYSFLGSCYILLGMKMKMFLIGVIIMMTLILVMGITWGKLFKRGYTQDEYGTVLAQRDKKIEDLEDSIRVMQVKLGVYEKAVKWFREADNDELQRGIEQIRSVPKDVPLP